MPSARQVNWAKFRASAVIVAGLLIFGALSFLLTGGTLLEPKAQIYLYLPDATGVAPGSPVRVDGIGVGKVTRVELSGSNEPNRVVKVTMSVGRDRLRSINDDSTAETTSDTIIGDKFIDVTSGTGAGHLMAGGELQYKGSGDLMQRLDIAQFQQQMHLIEGLQNRTQMVGQRARRRRNHVVDVAPLLRPWIAQQMRRDQAVGPARLVTVL